MMFRHTPSATHMCCSIALICITQMLNFHSLTLFYTCSCEASKKFRRVLGSQGRFCTEFGPIFIGLQFRLFNSTIGGLNPLKTLDAPMYKGVSHSLTRTGIGISRGTSVDNSDNDGRRGAILFVQHLFELLRGMSIS